MTLKWCVWTKWPFNSINNSYLNRNGSTAQTFIPNPLSIQGSGQSGSNPPPPPLRKYEELWKYIFIFPLGRLQYLFRSKSALTLEWAMGMWKTKWALEWKLCEIFVGNYSNMLWCPVMYDKKKVIKWMIVCTVYGVRVWQTPCKCAIITTNCASFTVHPNFISISEERDNKLSIDNNWHRIRGETHISIHFTFYYYYWIKYD